MNKFDGHIDILTERLNTTLKSKNHDYGDSYAESVDEYGKVIMAIRISDKLNRLKTLIKGDDRKVADESLEDTLLDLAGYSLLAIEYLKRKSGPGITTHEAEEIGKKALNDFTWEKAFSAHGGDYIK